MNSPHGQRKPGRKIHATSYRERALQSIIALRVKVPPDPPLNTVVLHPAGAASEPGVTLPPAARISLQSESNGDTVVVAVVMAVDAFVMKSVEEGVSALWVEAGPKREGSRQSGSSCPAAVLHSLSSCFLSFLELIERKYDCNWCRIRTTELRDTR